MERKKALVTGASSGIGYVFAKDLAKDGYLVTAVARNKTNLAQLIDQLGEDNNYICADLTNHKDLHKIQNELETNHYDLLINNAGYALYDRFENFSPEEHENVMYLNMNVVMRLSYAFLKNARAGDALINVSSALSRLGYPGGATYCGTKGFVTNFSESLWYEYKDKGIYVMALLPGVTKTNFHNVAFKGKDVELPAKFAQAPDLVVKEAISALKQRKIPSLLSGPRIRFMVTLVNKLMKREKMIKMMGKRNPVLRSS